MPVVDVSVCWPVDGHQWRESDLSDEVFKTEAMKRLAMGDGAPSCERQERVDQSRKKKEKE